MSALAACASIAAPPPPPPASAVTASAAPGAGPPGVQSTSIEMTGRATLVGAAPEQPGFGLYSYLLLTNHSPQSEDLYERALFYCFAHFENIGTLQQAGYDKSKINVTYVFTTSTPPPTASDYAWFAKNANDARALAIIRRLNRPLHPETQGPFIVAYTKPLSTSPAEPGKVLFIDLSKDAPANENLDNFIEQRMVAFLWQVEQPQYWKADFASDARLKINNELFVMAKGIGDTEEAVKKYAEVADLLSH